MRMETPRTEGNAVKKIIPWLAASAAVMLALPWLAVTCVNGVSGMMACFILFFAVNPIYAILAGAYAGRQIRSMWALPVITAALFLLGAWLCVDMGEMTFVFYALGYLALGSVAMLVSTRVKKIR